jgi:hypothetical protein
MHATAIRSSTENAAVKMRIEIIGCRFMRLISESVLGNRIVMLASLQPGQVTVNQVDLARGQLDMDGVGGPHVLRTLLTAGQGAEAGDGMAGRPNVKPSGRQE